MTHRLTLTRLTDSGRETMGVLRINDGIGHPLIYTLEDTWRHNEAGVSCIPNGIYTAVAHGWEPNSPHKFTRVWRLLNTAPREAILIHAGNTHLDTHGCILVGLARSSNSIAQSRSAVEYLRKVLGKDSFTLKIDGVK